VDAFYVVDMQRKKIVDPERIEDINEALLESIEAG